MSPTRSQTVVFVVGFAILLAGGYTVVVGVDGLSRCGSSHLTADAVSGDTGEKSPVPFRNLTEGQQRLVERAIDDERPLVNTTEWPWAESVLLVSYQGERYNVYTVTSPCPFSPEGIVAVGVSTLVVGLWMLLMAYWSLGDEASG